MKGTPRNANVTKHVASSSETDEDIQSTKLNHKRPSSSESDVKNQPNTSSSRPKTRRGLDDTFNNDTKQENPPNKDQPNTEIWRPSSGLNKKDPVDPLIGLDDLQNQTARSTEGKDSSNNLEIPFKEWYPTQEDDEDDD